MPTKTHLRDLTYENSTTRLTYENISAKTHLRDLSYENKPTRAHLLNSTTKHIYKKSTTRTHQQEFTLTYKISPTKPYLGIHIYKKLIYEYSPRTTILRELTY